MPSDPSLLRLVETVVVVMLENRSFDHMLGHLSLEGMTHIDGLREPFSRFDNPFGGSSHLPWSMLDGPLSCDLPHEHEAVQTQLAWSDVTGKYEMNGFVEAYAHAADCMVASSKVEPMGFLPSSQVPITSFFARNFCVCDRWFSPLPTSTQPNKTMALAGDSLIYETLTQQIPVGEMVFDWLDRHRVPWRVYAENVSFLALYQGWLKKILGRKFRSTKQLGLDVLTEPAATFPKVIFVEPAYDSLESIFGRHGNDNHAPLAVAFGEQFLRKVYGAVTSNAARWEKTVMIVTYDEHGGFFDHVPPLPIHYQVKSNPTHEFKSTGPRVPAVVISPLVKPGSVCHSNMDHTSILQFFAELFGSKDGDYSETVDTRRDAGISSVSVALTLDKPLSGVLPAPSQALKVSSNFGGRTAHGDAMQQAFANAVTRMVTESEKETTRRYPEIVFWSKRGS